MSISACALAFGALGIGLFLTTSAPAAPADSGGPIAPPSGDAGQVRDAKEVANGWTAKPFDYKRPDKLVVEESTPTASQASWIGRPPQLRADAADPVAGGPAKPRVEGPMEVVRLTFRDADGDVVPALLCTPRGQKGPFPLVIAIHGLTSNKAQVCAQVGPSLAKKGFAVLAADLPRHGERPGEPFSVVDASKPDQTFALARQAVNDVRQLIDIAENRADLDTRPGVTLAGYSLGSWVSAVVGPADPRVKRMVLMVGGAVDVSPVRLLPQVLATDPRFAIAHFAGRPVLMLNGKMDEIVKPDWAERLFAAAQEPKKQIWYESGHFLPADAYETAADWIAEAVGGGASKKKAEKADSGETTHRKAG